MDNPVISFAVSVEPEKYWRHGLRPGEPNGDVRIPAKKRLAKTNTTNTAAESEMKKTNFTVRFMCSRSTVLFLSLLLSFLSFFFFFFFCSVSSSASS